MIETLRIENLAIVDRLELEFSPGLNVFTGETGAGKSLVLGALALLSGGRAPADGVREGSDDAAVEAVFRTESLADLEAVLAERGYSGDAHEMVVRRSLSRGGRSRAQLGGQIVPAATLAEIFSGRIEISSQHDSQALLRTEQHGRLLDRLGGLGALRSAVAEGHAALRALDEELEALREAARERAQRRDFLSFQVSEIDAARLEPGAVEALRSERSRLAHTERLREEGAAALSRLIGDPVAADSSGAADLLADAERRLLELAGLDPDLAGVARRLTEARAEVRDTALDLERHLDRIEADPGRLAAADERLHEIEALQRKYGADVEAVLAHRDAAAEELARVEGADARETEIVASREERAAALAGDAAALSAGRRRAARKLARTVTATLSELAMKDARFEVSLDPAPVSPGVPCGPTGAEVPAFLLSANVGEAPRPLRRVASGGELSRAFLAIKQALRETHAGMVLVFDEVDAGIGGGRAADRVGHCLAELAARHQVLVITHLPQIAAYAETHFRVRKRGAGGRTTVRIERVEGDDRVEEIARMAGGAAVAESTREHARALLRGRISP